MKKMNFYFKPALVLVFGFVAALFFQNCAKNSFNNNTPTGSENLKASSQNDFAVQDSLAVEKSACGGVNNNFADTDWHQNNGLPNGVVVSDIFSNMQIGTAALYPVNLQDRALTVPHSITISGSFILPATAYGVVMVVVWGTDEKCKFRVYSWNAVHINSYIVNEGNVITDKIAYPTLIKALVGLPPVDRNTISEEDWSKTYASLRIKSGPIYLNSFFTQLNKNFYKLAVGRELNDDPVRLDELTFF